MNASQTSRGSHAPVADDDLATCVSCGLCLPHCPTYRVTGDESRSPRGRIAIIKTVQDQGGTYDRETADMLNSCIQCRGCEPACPSGVPYGRIIGGAREELVRQGLAPSRRTAQFALQMGLGVLRRPRLLALAGRLVAFLQALRVIPRRWSPGPVRVRLGSRLIATGTVTNPDVWIFTGCVMDVWMRPTHRNTAALVQAAGQTFAVPLLRGACCGALHQHAGQIERARSMARAVMASMPGEGLVLVNSAGCGAALKEYGELLGTHDAHTFSARVRDIHEWLVPFMDTILARASVSLEEMPERPVVVLQDPCHLRHVQKSHGAVRIVLDHVAEVLTIDDDGLCCGAGGAYSLMEPALASQVRARKVDAIHAATKGRPVRVASANPGCSMFLAQAGLRVDHPVDIVADVLGLQDRAANATRWAEKKRV